MSKNVYRAKHSLGRLIGPLGLFAIARTLTRSAPRIVMYHRFSEKPEYGKVSADAFRRQVRFLKNRFDVVTMRDLANQLDNGGIRPRQAVVTIDDGYADAFEVAFPILKEEGVPATFFVTTGFVDREIWLWPDKLNFILKLRHHDSNRVREKWVEFVDHLLPMTPEKREARLSVLAESFEIEVPCQPPKEYAAASWQNLNEMTRNGVEIGGHTASHPRLPLLSDVELQLELADSKKRIEEELSLSVTSFCYPNGDTADYDARVEKAVVAAGYRSAVAAYHDGYVGDRTSLRRFPGGEGWYDFSRQLSGVSLLKRRTR